jgi:hypothetical protein
MRGNAIPAAILIALNAKFFFIDFPISIHASPQERTVFICAPRKTLSTGIPVRPDMTASAAAITEIFLLTVYPNGI